MKKKLILILSYIIEFTVCAFCGWLYEEGLELLVNHAYADRGVLHLPLLPIYGFGGLLVIALFRKQQHPLFVFAVSTVATTALELAASYPLEKILGYLPWDYSGWWLHFDGRISLPSSLLFGMLALVLVNLVHPLCRRLSERWHPRLICTLGAVCAAAIASDFVVSVVLPLVRGKL